MEAEDKLGLSINNRRRNRLVELIHRYLWALFGFAPNYLLDPAYLKEWIPERTLHWPLGRLVLQKSPNSEKFHINYDLSTKLLFDPDEMCGYLNSFMSKSELNDMVDLGLNFEKGCKYRRDWYGEHVVEVDENGHVRRLPLWIKNRSDNWLMSIHENFSKALTLPGQRPIPFELLLRYF